MSHPDPNGPADRRPIKVGEIWENPVIGERATILERPWDNPAGRATGELTALVGARVMGEHRHPALVEEFTVLEGELTVKRNGHTSILQRHNRVPFAAAGGAAARLSPDVPAVLAHCAGPADVAPASQSP